MQSGGSKDEAKKKRSGGCVYPPGRFVIGSATVRKMKEKDSVKNVKPGFHIGKSRWMMG
jgi:hypothetical protein